MSRIRLDERDFGKIVTVLAYGLRPHPRRSVLVCACGQKSGNIQTNPKAWNGWQTVPFAKCFCCLEGKKEK